MKIGKNENKILRKNWEKIGKKILKKKWEKILKKIGKKI